MTPTDQDRREAQAARAAALAKQDTEGVPYPNLQAENPDVPQIAAQAEPAVQIGATFVPAGIEVTILIPHEGITINLPEPDGTTEA